MGRHIEFCKDDVLKSAMTIFWERGYNDTSIKDIVAHTNVKPGSLYSAFNGKSDLFQQSLRLYGQENYQFLEHYLKTDAAPLLRIRNLLAALLERLTADNGQKGCLLANSLSEFPGTDSDVQMILRDEFDKIRKLLESVVVEGQDRGDIPTSSKAEDLSTYLLNNLLGLRLMAKTQPSDAQKKRLVDTIINGVSPA
ncbi:MAG: TetR/AcrR family transcriptional regulator [Sphingomonadales bacterium]|nr:TetR/AcrR family transcriptional regulator [Sphingomonadales bacterium]